MKFNLPLPFDRTDATAPDFLTMEAVAQVGQTAERAGFSAGLVTDHPCPTGRWLDTGGHHAHDPFVMLSLIAAVTKSLRLQTGILVLPYRNPFVVARSVASLDRFSGGRVTLSVAVGYLKGEYRAVGVDFEQRHALTDEYIRALKVSLTGEEFEFEGTGYIAYGNRILPGPVQTPPPILVGGNAKRAIRRAVELGDGWNPFFNGGFNIASNRTAAMATEDDLAAGIAYMKEHCEKVGRKDLPQVVPGSIAMVGESWTPQSIIDRAGRFAEMGVSAVGMNIQGRSLAEWCDNVERFGSDVISKM